MKLSIVTINYNGSGSTIGLLKSLKEQSDSYFEVIVVDNASERGDLDNLKAYISRESQGVLLIENAQNLGFSGGNNVGIRQGLEMGSDWVVLLNNDTLVEKDFIAQLKAILSLRKGIVGLPMDEGWGIAYAGKIKWLRYPRGFHVMDLKKARALRNFYIIGAGMAIDKDVFDKIGFLDEKYFLYFEDIDYSVRALKNNISMAILDRPIVHHTPSSTTKKLGRPTLFYYHYRNALYFNSKNGPWYIKILVWPWSWFIITKQLFKIGVGIHEEESREILKGVFDFYKNKYGKI